MLCLCACVVCKRVSLCDLKCYERKQCRCLSGIIRLAACYEGFQYALGGGCVGCVWGVCKYYRICIARLRALQTCVRALFTYMRALYACVAFRYYMRSMRVVCVHACVACVRCLRDVYVRCVRALCVCDVCMLFTSVCALYVCVVCVCIVCVLFTCVRALCVYVVCGWVLAFGRSLTL